ncbi:Protein FLUORESCENT IN BLUE LIGHT, chloroplastic [Triticum urartu]|uniref:Protein FLUORESCENT IN BLUE LIGHT, chloroplastic n=2 Tax=Triticum TaxID=4564 RepID=A0A9R0TNH3_TRITD|nr:Protein FLUORESCENT IN BLUE LIGHT, chloroplastic [Triticum urartu]VAI17132.1 unnamed protein product [Triticum turgidum subsp. durum]
MATVPLTSMPLMLSSVRLEMHIFFIMFHFERMFLVARHASSSTDPVRPGSDNFDIANGHGHVLIKSTSDLQKAVSSCFGKALVTSSAVMLVMPPSCLAEECDPGYSLPNMPLLFAIAMVGATVGEKMTYAVVTTSYCLVTLGYSIEQFRNPVGLLARQRKGELKKLNDQLRQINASLRRQAKIESYAPALSYAPAASKIPESEVIVDPHKQRLLTYLRTGKNYLRNQAPDKAFSEFKAALDLAQSLGDHVEEKKAARGLGASLQRQGNYKEAIKYHSMVLSISKMTGEDSGVTEAYGAIADCYTEVGELEKAGKFYDEYIARLEND